jgi:signal transduction histidine kinase
MPGCDANTKAPGSACRSPKQLVEMHGGTLAIDNARGAGTTVTVLLPAVQVMAAA